MYLYRDAAVKLTWLDADNARSKPCDDRHHAMAALPPALNVFIMARQYDTWVAQASGSVLFVICATKWPDKSGTLPATQLR